MSTAAGVRLPNVDRLAPFSLEVEPMSVAGHLFARDGKVPEFPARGDEVDWSYFTLLRAQFRLGASIHELMDRDPAKGLMVGITYAGTDGRARVGEGVDAVCDLAEQRVIERPAGALVLTTVRTTWTSRERPWTLVETTAMADLWGDHDPPELVGPTAPGPEVDLGPTGRLRVAWCCVATEDLQTVHHDPRLAVERGYADVLVPGTWIASVAERELRARHPGGVSGLTARFVAPCYPDDHLVWRWGDDDAFEIHRCGDTDSSAAVVAVGGGRLS